MNESINLWEALAGVAVFMLGIRFLEDSLQEMAGRSFKLFLKKNTANRIRAVAGGTVITAVLQSSSVVNLLVLAFVGASLLTIQNALAVILGANFGTTIGNWVIATVGFTYEVSDFAYPLTGVAGVVMALSKKGSAWYHRSMFLLGFSFIFLGLGFIKNGIEEVILNYDFSGFSAKPHALHLLAGFIITSLIQSSSATMAIILSLLHADGINLQAAMAVTLGSELGTTVKVVIASFGDNSVKKQVATGNFIFNIITVGLIFIFLSSFHYFIAEILGFSNDLIALVAFQSLINLVCIFLFLPFLPAISKWLEKLFVESSNHTVYISKSQSSVPDMALSAIDNEAKRFLKLELLFTLKCLDISQRIGELPADSEKFLDLDIHEQYDYLKILHGKIHSFNSKLLMQNLDEVDSVRLERLISGVRNTMYAAKSVHDAAADIQQLKNSSKDEKYGFYQRVQQRVLSFCEKIDHLMDNKAAHQELAGIYKNMVKEYEENLNELYKPEKGSQLTMTEISTLLNFNREMISSFKSVVFALKDLMLHKEEADEFDAMPGFIR